MEQVKVADPQEYNPKDLVDHFPKSDQSLDDMFGVETLKQKNEFIVDYESLFQNMVENGGSGLKPERAKGKGRGRGRGRGKGAKSVMSFLNLQKNSNGV